MKQAESNTRRQSCVTSYVFLNRSETEEAMTDTIYKLGFVLELLRVQNDN
jgi:hypothetical protein